MSLNFALNTGCLQQNNVVRNLAESLVIPQSLTPSSSSNALTNANVASTHTSVASTTLNSCLLERFRSGLCARRHSVALSVESGVVSNNSASLHTQKEQQTNNKRRFSCT